MLRSVGSKGVSHDLSTEHQPGSSLHYGSRRLPLACVLLLSLLSRLPGFSAIFMPLTFGSNSLLSPFWVQNPDLDSSLSSESSSSRTGSSSFHPLLLPAAPRDDSARPSPRGPARLPIPYPSPPDKRGREPTPWCSRKWTQSPRNR